MDDLTEKPELTTKPEPETNTTDKPHNGKRIAVVASIVVAFLAVASIGLITHSKDNDKVKSLNGQVTANKEEIQSLKDSNKKLVDTYNELKVTNTKLEESNDKLEDKIKANEAAKKVTPEPESKETACGEPQLSENGGPLPGHVKADTIEFVTGVWMPQHIDIKTGTTVTWAMDVGGQIPQLAVENDTDSCEKFSSSDLKTGARYTHTFNKPGVFGWHDKYSGNLSGYTITVYP